MSENWKDKLSAVRVFVFDVDGVLTDGGLTFDEQGRMSKRFYVRDGSGIHRAKSAGYTVVWITGHSPQCVERGARELGVDHFFSEIWDKQELLRSLMKDRDWPPESLAYMGDDRNDIRAMRLCGLRACPSDACADVLDEVDYVASKPGGGGAVRDLIELVMRHHGTWPPIAD